MPLSQHKSGASARIFGGSLRQDDSDVEFDVLLYDLTSAYFEANPPFDDGDKRGCGHARDRCSDCGQVVIALVVTPQGLPLAYEVLPGNTADNAITLECAQSLAGSW